MANHSKNRQRAKSPAHPRSAGRGVPSTAQKKPNSLLFWFVALTVPFVLVFYLSKQEGGSSSDSELPAELDTALTIEERVKKKNKQLQLEQKIHSQDVVSEKFQKPVGDIDPMEPDISPLDMGIRFSEDASMREVSKKLAELPFENDMYEDPEDVVRRKLAQEEWLEQQLQKKNERERKEFIRRFVETAREQGYHVHFTKDMKEVILEPIDEKNKEEEEEVEFEKVQIDWK